MSSFLRITIATFFSLIICVPMVHAETVVRTGEKITLSDDQSVDGDFYAVAGPVLLSGDISEDAHILAGSVTTNGEIGSDLFVVGGSVQVHASVTDDVRVLGGEITIAEYVGGDVMVLGGMLTILSTAKVDGDIFFYGGEGEINGEVQGSVHGMSEKLRIDGPVQGDVDVRTGSLVIGDRADIGGNLTYQSPNELIRSQGAVIVGDIVQNDMPRTHKGPQEKLIPILIYAFSVLLLLAIFRNHLKPVLVDTMQHFTRNGLIGLAGIIFIPGLVLLSFVTVIGSMIGFVVLFASFAVWLVSMLLVAIFAGLILQKLLRKEYEASLLWALLGIVGVVFVSLIPIIGVILLFVSTIAIFGGLLYSFYQKFI